MGGVLQKCKHPERWPHHLTICPVHIFVSYTKTNTFMIYSKLRFCGQVAAWHATPLACVYSHMVVSSCALLRFCVSIEYALPRLSTVIHAPRIAHILFDFTHATRSKHKNATNSASPLSAAIVFKILTKKYLNSKTLRDCWKTPRPNDSFAQYLKLFHCSFLAALCIQTIYTHLPWRKKTFNGCIPTLNRKQDYKTHTNTRWIAELKFSKHVYSVRSRNGRR